MPYNPDNHSGGEGTAVIGGTDANVTDWEGSESADLVDVTTTGDYDSADKLTYGRDKGVKRRYEATLNCFIDGNNYLLGAIRAGNEVQNVVLTMFSGHTVSMSKAIVATIPIKSGGTGGVQSYSFTIKSQGKYTIS